LGNLLWTEGKIIPGQDQISYELVWENPTDEYSAVNDESEKKYSHERSPTPGVYLYNS
jgi:hypothetical protein